MNTSLLPVNGANAGMPVRSLPGDAFPVPAVGSPDLFQPGAAAQESIIHRYWRILMKRRLIIAAVMIACVIAAVALAMMTQRRYAAIATIEIAREAEEVVSLGDEKGRVQSAANGMEFYQTQYALLRSRALAQAVVRSLRLADNQDFLTDYGQADPAQIPQQRAIREQIATGIVMGNTDVMPVRMSSVVNIRHNSPNPQMAATIANAIATNFIEMNLARRFEATAYAREFLQNQLNQLRQRLEASERQAVAYAQQNQIINIAPAGPSVGGQTPAQQSLVGASLAQANQALAEARTARIAAEARYRQAGAGQSEALQNPTLNALRSQRAELGAQHQRLLSDFGPEYPTVRATAAQMAELDRQIGVESSRVTSAVGGEVARQYRQALATENELAQRVEQLKSGVLDLRRRSIQYDILQREVETNRSLYEAVLQQYRERGIAGGVGTNNISIVDRALLPGAPYQPSLRFNIMVALLIGLVLGALIALLLEQLDESAILPEDFQNKLGIPLIGNVPASPEGLPVELLRDPKSPMSEAYFSVLTGLQFSTSHGTPKTLLVTSTQPGEGKSTTAYALAQGLAKLGKQVLLIDADMRNPSVHKTLGVTNQAGLSNLLVGDGTIETLARPTETPSLSVITSGPIPPNPAELLASDKLKEVLNDGETRFDHIVVDAPPVLGLADAPLLARSVEATVFALEAGRTKAGQARQALNRLFAIRAPVVGAVLTKFHAQRAGYGYGYGYSYQYSYGERSSAPAGQ